ncbi:MAG TPA: hypothetical protein VF665_00910 [Longimicrobium sp.]|jgi:hypothetical protein|uniref:hypothetical protein n=1 Tax=Longimicrobium sp. TaxID=2029185 RepID=UPI002ED98377
MRPSLRALAALAALTAAAGLAAARPARAADPLTPSQTVQALFDALFEGRWREAANLITPESAAGYQRSEVTRLAEVEFHRGQVRAWRHSRRAADTTRPSMPFPPFNPVADDTLHLSLFAGSHSVRELLAMPPTQFLTRAFGEAGFRFEPPPGESRTIRIVGEIIREDTLGYVVAHGLGENENVDRTPELLVVQLRMHRGRWRVVMTRAFHVPIGTETHTLIQVMDTIPG